MSFSPAFALLFDVCVRRSYVLAVPATISCGLMPVLMLFQLLVLLLVHSEVF
jgi:hypothetical protein